MLTERGWSIKVNLHISGKEVLPVLPVQAEYLQKTGM